MSNQITSKFKIESWEEQPFSESEDGPALIRASVKQSYTGSIEGEGTISYLMTTFNESFSSFIGIERLSGQIDGRSGSFVLRHEGTYENGVAKSSCRIIANSGTGELSGIQGQGGYEATHEEATFKLDYTLE